MAIRSPGDLGLAIRDRRKQLGLDQQTLARRAGVSRQWIVAVEHGKARAEIGLLLKTLRVLDVELEVKIANAEARTRTRNAPDIDALIERAKDRKR